MPNDEYLYDQSMCGNCGRWREEHYNEGDGSWIPGQPCGEYRGVTPPIDRWKNKRKELAKIYGAEAPIE